MAQRRVGRKKEKGAWQERLGEGNADKWDTRMIRARDSLIGWKGKKI